MTFVRLSGHEIRVHARFHFASAVLHEVGLRRPARQRTDGPAETVVTLSAEHIPDLDADVLLYTVGGGLNLDTSRQALARYKPLPLRQQLRAVQAASTLSAPATGSLAASAPLVFILDDLERPLLDDPLTTTAPGGSR